MLITNLFVGLDSAHHHGAEKKEQEPLPGNPGNGLDRLVRRACKLFAVVV